MGFEASRNVMISTDLYSTFSSYQHDSMPSEGYFFMGASLADAFFT